MCAWLPGSLDCWLPGSWAPWLCLAPSLPCSLAAWVSGSLAPRRQPQGGQKRSRGRIRWIQVPEVVFLCFLMLKPTQKPGQKKGAKNLTKNLAKNLANLLNKNLDSGFRFDSRFFFDIGCFLDFPRESLRNSDPEQDLVFAYQMHRVYARDRRLAAPVAREKHQKG